MKEVGRVWGMSGLLRMWPLIGWSLGLSLARSEPLSLVPRMEAWPGPGESSGSG